MNVKRGAAILGRGRYIEQGTINTKPSVLDYRREQMAVKDKETESERKSRER